MLRQTRDDDDGAMNGRWGRYGLLVGALWLVPLHAAAQTWVPTDISALGGATTGEAYGVNDNGTVVGTPGFVWAGGSGWIDLGGEGMIPYGINSAGQVTGFSFSSIQGSDRAFLWTASDGKQNIGTLGTLSTSYGYGINSAGQIVGTNLFLHTTTTQRISVDVWFGNPRPGHARWKHQRSLQRE